ncbi:MAG: hypothetical protein Q8L47_00740 [bacterium]|nr:hypothetical protein [bacterium]
MTTNEGLDACIGGMIAQKWSNATPEERVSFVRDYEKQNLDHFFSRLRTQLTYIIDPTNPFIAEYCYVKNIVEKSKKQSFPDSSRK